MKTENVKTCQKSPNFGAIRVPVSSYSAKFNPKTIMDVMEHHIPSNRIKISRGKTKNGEIVDYIMTRFNSLKEKNIFDEIVNLGEKFTTTSAKKTKKDTVRFDKARQPLGDEVHVLAEYYFSGCAVMRRSNGNRGAWCDVRGRIVVCTIATIVARRAD